MSKFAGVNAVRTKTSHTGMGFYTELGKSRCTRVGSSTVESI